MVKVSIIVPIYNGEEYINKSLDSILNQDYKDFELLLIDDKSSDNSLNIMNEYAKKDKRVKVFHCDTRKGVSGARNVGLDNANGEYIQFVDCDDYIVRDATKNFLRSIEKSDVDMIVSYFYRVVGDVLSIKGDIDENVILTREKYVDFIAKNPADLYYGVVWNKLYKGDIIKKYNIRFDKLVMWGEDFIFNLEYLLHVNKVKTILSPMYYYVKREGSIVTKSVNNFTNIVKMKLTAFEYYNNFYKEIYSDVNSIKRKIDVYKFFFAYSKDYFTIPFMPGTKKVGKEDLPVFVYDFAEDNLFHDLYYINKLLDRYLYSVSLKFKLELKELKVLIYLRYNKNIVDFIEPSDYVACSQITLHSLLQKLNLKKYVIVSKKNSKLVYTLGKKSEQVMKELDNVMRDFYSICGEGIEDIDKNKYYEYYKTTIMNIKNRLST